MSDKHLGSTVALPGISDLKAIQMLRTYPQWMDYIWKSKTLSDGLISALTETANIPQDLAEMMHTYGLKAFEFIKEYYQLRIHIQSGVDLDSTKESLRDLWNKHRHHIPIAQYFAKYLETTIPQVLLGLDRKDRSVTRPKDRAAKLLEYQILPTYLETTKRDLTPWVEIDHPIAEKIIEQMKQDGIPSDVIMYRTEIINLLDFNDLQGTHSKLLALTNDRLQKWYEKGYLQKALLEITEFDDVLAHILKESGLTYSRLTELLASAKDLEKLRPYIHVLKVMEAVEERFKPRFSQFSIEVQLRMFLKNDCTGQDLTWIRGLLFEDQSGPDRITRLRMSDQEIMDKLVEYWNTKQTISDELSLGETKSGEDAALTEKFAGKLVNFVVFHPLNSLKLFTELYDWQKVHVSDIGIEIRALHDQYRRIMLIGKAIANLYQETQMVFPDLDSNHIRALTHSSFMNKLYNEALETLPSTPSTLTRTTFGEDSSFKIYPNLVAQNGWWPLALETLINFEEKVSGIRAERMEKQIDDFDPEKAYISVASSLIKRLSSLSAQALAGTQQTFALPGYDAEFSIRKALNPLIEIERKTKTKPLDVFVNVLNAEVPMPMGSQTTNQLLLADIFQNDTTRHESFLNSLQAKTHIMDLSEFFSSEIVRSLIGNMIEQYGRLGQETVLENLTTSYVSDLRQMRTTLRRSERDDWGNVMGILTRFSDEVDQTLEKALQFRNTALSQLANYIIQPSKFLQGVLKDLGFGRKGIINDYIERTLKETMVLNSLLRRFRLGTG